MRHGADRTCEVQPDFAPLCQRTPASLAAYLELRETRSVGLAPDTRNGWNPVSIQPSSTGLSAASRRARDRFATTAELWDHFVKGLNHRNVTIDYVFPTPDDAIQAWDSLPSFDVACSIKTKYHRDPRHVWTTNDIADIDALGRRSRIATSSSQIEQSRRTTSGGPAWRSASAQPSWRGWTIYLRCSRPAGAW